MPIFMINMECLLGVSSPAGVGDRGRGMKLSQSLSAHHAIELITDMKHY